jgi:hypothetical protein
LRARGPLARFSRPGGLGTGQSFDAWAGLMLAILPGRRWRIKNPAMD